MLDITRIKRFNILKFKANLVLGRGLEFERFLEEMQDVTKSRLRFTRQIAR